MTNPLPDEELERIERGLGGCYATCDRDVRALVSEVRRLQSALAEAEQRGRAFEPDDGSCQCHCMCGRDAWLDGLCVACQSCPTIPG